MDSLLYCTVFYDTQDSLPGDSLSGDSLPRESLPGDSLPSKHDTPGSIEQIEPAISPGSINRGDYFFHNQIRQNRARSMTKSRGTVPFTIVRTSTVKV